MINRTLRIWPVLNYHTALMSNRTLRIWPALAKLLCRFMKQRTIHLLHDNATE